MRSGPTKRPWHSGVTLLEAVISIGVLAVAVPLVYGTLGEASKSGASSEAETRSTWIIPACMEEVRASREGRSEYFPDTLAGEVFPGDGELWVLAFSRQGELLGKVSASEYEQGMKDLDGEPPRFVVTMKARKEEEEVGRTPMLGLAITMEYPAVAPREKRRELEFHTRIP